MVGRESAARRAASLSSPSRPGIADQLPIKRRAERGSRRTPWTIVPAQGHCARLRGPSRQPRSLSGAGCLGSSPSGGADVLNARTAGGAVVFPIGRSRRRAAGRVGGREPTGLRALYRAHAEQSPVESSAVTPTARSPARSASGRDGPWAFSVPRRWRRSSARSVVDGRRLAGRASRWPSPSRTTCLAYDVPRVRRARARRDGLRRGGPRRLLLVVRNTG